MTLSKHELEQRFGRDEVDVAIDNIDNELGKGYAEMNLDLLEAYVEYLCRLQNSPSKMPRSLQPAK